MDYSTMTKIGRIVIDESNQMVNVTIEGFEFSDTMPCREHAARVLNWAQRLLENQLEAGILAPGGNVSVGLG